MSVPRRRDAASRATRRPAGQQSPADLYHRDVYNWALQQAAALRAGDLERLDLTNLAEEIQDLGSEQLHKLTSAYRVILIHMLKWDHQPERRTRSWVTSIRSHQAAAGDVLEDSPGLRSRQPVALARGYRRARIDAGGETGLGEDAFPETCPYTLDEVMSRDFVWPAANRSTDP
jgi:hypothetical protein